MRCVRCGEGDLVFSDARGYMLHEFQGGQVFLGSPLICRDINCSKCGSLLKGGAADEAWLSLARKEEPRSLLIHRRGWEPAVFRVYRSSTVSEWTETYWIKSLARHQVEKYAEEQWGHQENTSMSILWRAKAPKGVHYEAQISAEKYFQDDPMMHLTLWDFLQGKNHLE